METYREFAADGTTVTLERETLHVNVGQENTALIETRTTGTDPAPAQLQRYQYANHLGSAILELDDQALIISYEEYFPYGSTSYQAVRSQTELPKRYRYTSKERDDENDLYYHGTRYYAPWLGTWLSTDPAPRADDTNLYAYVRGNPVRLIDPSGTEPTPPGSNDPDRRLKEAVNQRIAGAFQLQPTTQPPPPPNPGPDLTSPSAMRSAVAKTIERSEIEEAEKSLQQCLINPGSLPEDHAAALRALPRGSYVATAPAPGGDFVGPILKYVPPPAEPTHPQSDYEKDRNKQAAAADPSTPQPQWAAQTTRTAQPGDALNAAFKLKPLQDLTKNFGDYITGAGTKRNTDLITGLAVSGVVTGIEVAGATAMALALEPQAPSTSGPPFTAAQTLTKAVNAGISGPYPPDPTPTPSSTVYIPGTTAAITTPSVAVGGELFLNPAATPGPPGVPTSRPDFDASGRGVMLNLTIKF